MKNYSKLIGSVVGAVIGLAAAFGLDVEWMTPEVQGALVSVLAIVGTFVAPSNKKP